MVDKDRILIKIDKLDQYLNEIAQIKPATLDEYLKIEKKRSCERLLQLCIECSIDICKLFVSGFRLGIPSEEDDLLSKLRKKGILSEEIMAMLEEMRSFRNILVHEYAVIDDEIVFEILKTRIRDFQKFKSEVVKSIQ